jgi:hypothetical protein
MMKPYLILFFTFTSCVIFAQSARPGNAGMKKCDAGPQILKITGVTGQRAKVQFYGNNVFGLDARVFDQSGRLVSQSKIVPQSPDIVVPLQNLRQGNYILKLSGNTCIGQSERAFTVPDPSARLALAASDKAVKFITQGYGEHLGVVITGKSGNWIVNDTASVEPDAGYEFRYMINGVILKQNNPLTNYKYQSDSPLRILKMQTKVGLQSVNQWSDKEKNGYFDPEAGKVFSTNVTAGFCTVVFQSSGFNNSQGFLNPVPSNYNPDVKTASWADIAPDMKLPTGHFWVANRGDWSIETIQRKGVTHISNYQLPWQTNVNEVNRLKSAGLTYNDVPRPEAFMDLKPSGPDKWQNNYNLKYWPNGPLNEQEAIKKADQTDDGHALWIGETMEGNSYMPPEQPMWGSFYKKLRQRYESNFGARKIPFQIAHNYFMFWPAEFKLEDGNGLKEARKKMFSMPVIDFPQTNFKPGGTLSSTNLIVEGVYLNAPDIQNGALYNSLYRMELFKKMGYQAGVFLFGVHEWRPNNAYLYNYPDGKYYRKDKLPLEPNIIIAYAFISQIYGNTYVEWGSSGKQVKVGRNWDTQWGSGDWYPSGQRTARDGFRYIVKQGEPAYAGYTGSSDLSYFGIKLYNNTFGQVEGGVKKYLRFRVDGAAWTDPEEIAGNNIVNAFYEKRGFVLSQTKNGKTAWFYVNSFADNLAHKLEVVLPDGKIESLTVAGNGIHARLE